MQPTQDLGQGQDFPLPFSILGRIGGDATILAVLGILIGAIWLSVSSVGSEAMQLGGRVVSEREFVTFSILGRIGGDATRP